MKRAPIKDLNELKGLKNQLKVRAEQEKLVEQERQSAERTVQKEATLFRTHVGNVRPIKSLDIYLSSTSPIFPKNTDDKLKEIRTMSEVIQVMEQWSDEFDASSDQENSEQDLSYAIKGSSPDLLKKLRKGQWSVQARLDLHGLDRNQARAALSDFLRKSKQVKLRCVCVIYGKGIHSQQSAVLPAKVRGWLSQSEFVQAFCPANPQEGGEGGLYVLFKSARKG
jgi:DNA-nicking Smr family endonuclease